MRKAILSTLFSIGAVTNCTYVYSTDYMGDYCWEISESGVPSGVFKAGISHIGGGHYTVNGRVIPYDNFDSQEVTNGNAELSGSNILMTLTTSYLTEDGLETGICKVVLNSVLNGSIECIDHTTAGNSEYFFGIATNKSCP